VALGHWNRAEETRHTFFLGTPAGQGDLFSAGDPNVPQMRVTYRIVFSIMESLQ
jgi:hypothetical protein